MFKDMPFKSKQEFCRYVHEHFDYISVSTLNNYWVEDVTKRRAFSPQKRGPKSELSENEVTVINEAFAMADRKTKGKGHATAVEAVQRLLPRNLFVQSVTPCLIPPL